MFTVPEKWISENSKQFIFGTYVHGYVGVLEQHLNYSYNKENFKSVRIEQHGNIVSGTLPTIQADFTVENYATSSSSHVISVNDIPEFVGEQFWFEYGFYTSDSIAPAQITDLRFFVSDIKIDSKNGTATIQTKDVISFMTNEYTGITNSSADRILESVFSQAAYDSGVPKTDSLGFRYTYDESVGDIEIDIQGTYSMAEVLQLVANACCCVLFVDRLGVIHIEPVSEETSQYAVPAMLQYTKPQIDIEPKIGSVKVITHNFTVTRQTSSGIGNVETVTNNVIDVLPLQTTAVADWVIDTIAEHPQTVSTEYRADPRAELFDRILFEFNNEIHNVVITDLIFTYNGSWRGTITGRDFGIAELDGDATLDVYNTLMEYLASLENGTGNYNYYTESFHSLLLYLNGTIDKLRTWGSAYASGMTWGEAEQYKWEDAGI